jgi:hypothetical protein
MATAGQARLLLAACNALQQCLLHSMQGRGDAGRQRTCGESWPAASHRASTIAAAAPGCTAASRPPDPSSRTCSSNAWHACICKATAGGVKCRAARLEQADACSRTMLAPGVNNSNSSPRLRPPRGARAGGASAGAPPSRQRKTREHRPPTEGLRSPGPQPAPRAPHRQCTPANVAGSSWQQGAGRGHDGGE